MRGISFRGMDINGKWHYGLLAESAGFPNQPDAGVYISNFAGYPWAFQVRIETVGQYTGLKDKNGKGGYHKDLWLFHGVVYTVEWDDDNAEFYLKHPNVSAGEDDHIKMSGFGLGEIVGSIHESPELLQQPTG